MAAVSGVSFHIEDYQEIIAKAKAATDMPEEAKTELVAFAEGVLQAEAERIAKVADLMRKYCTGENIQPEKPDDDDPDNNGI